jgi:hypothetical protein
MAVFPTLGSGRAFVYSDIVNNPLAQYPVTRNTSYLTRVIQFANGKEQRWTVRGRLASFVLEYRNVNDYDTGILLKFFHDMRGPYVDSAMVNTFSLTVGGVTYDYCCFDQDSVEVATSQSGVNSFSFTLRIKQLRRN